MSSTIGCGRTLARRLPAILTIPAFLLPVCVPWAAQAQTATELPPVAVDTVKESPLGGSSVTPDQLDQTRTSTGDAASLLGSIPGVNLQANGGISSLPSIHGLADDRILSLIDGVQTTSACPNHMNPPLSYAEPQAVDQAEVYSGIAPVSLGGDNIGGVVALKSKPPLFAGPGQGIVSSGQVSAYYKSNASNVGSSVQAAMAGEDLSLGVTSGWNRAADYRSGNGTVVESSSYENEDYAVTAAAQKDGQTLVLKGGQQFVPYQNFPNQQMDMVGNHQAFLNADYKGEFDWGKLDARGYWNSVSHKMDSTATDRGAYVAMWGVGNGMPMPMLTRGTDTGYSIKAELPLSKADTLRVGNELHMQTLNDWWPSTGMMMMSPNAFININDGRRDRFGTYAEWETNRWNPSWTTLLGVRNDLVWSDAGNVQGYETTDYGADASAFNAVRHSRLDVNFDATAIEKFDRTDNETWDIGYARKTRSPSLYERYAWSTLGMTAGMIGWFGDGNGYVGNPDLRPEIAHTVSLSGDWHDAAREDWEIKATPYYTYVHDYINVDYVGPNIYSASFSGPGSILRFANHDAELYGADLSGRKTLADDAAWGKFGLGGTAGFVRGFQINNGNSLYHMMPLNMKLTLDHKLDGWSSAIDLRMVDGKSEADPLRQEPITPGFAVVNLRTAYDWQNFRVDLGIENLFDHQYYDPLAGVAVSNFINSGGNGSYQPLPAMGRSFNAGVTVKF